jgi:hypothetical protein
LNLVEEKGIAEMKELLRGVIGSFETVEGERGSLKNFI